MTEHVYEDRWGEVFDRPSRDLIELRWFDTTAEMSAQEFQAWLTKFADCVERCRRTGVLVDSTAFRMSPTMMDGPWRDANIIPRYNAAGVRRLAPAGPRPTTTTVPGRTRPGTTRPGASRPCAPMSASGWGRRSDQPPVLGVPRSVAGVDIDLGVPHDLEQHRERRGAQRLSPGAYLGAQRFWRRQTGRDGGQEKHHPGAPGAARIFRAQNEKTLRCFADPAD